jgi:hypothetical protein
MKPKTGTHCGVFEPPDFEKNNYYYGKQFTVRDLAQEQRYFNNKRRLINRMTLGWGVVCGLDVSWKGNEFVVGPGMALDCCGNEIVVCNEERIPFENYEETCRQAGETPGYKGKFALCLEYKECLIEPVDLPLKGCEKQERTECNRIRDWFKLRIKPWKEACHKHPGGCVRCLGYFKHDDDHKTIVPCRTKPLHEHLCELQVCPECKCCACVVLATFQVRMPDETSAAAIAEKHHQTKPVLVEEVDTCTDRRLVYSNPRLFDLINCYHGDLPHIADFNWRHSVYPKREVAWGTFVKMVKDGLTVYFDQEMSGASLNQHTFIVSFLHLDEGTGSIVDKRIPVKEIQTGWDNNCYKATYIADADWVNDELTAKNSQLAEGVEVEITLRGSRILNKQKTKALDGDFIADKLPTGNGTQGGDFVDWFRVLPRTAEEAKAAPNKNI